MSTGVSGLPVFPDSNSAGDSDFTGVSRQRRDSLWCSSLPPGVVRESTSARQSLRTKQNSSPFMLTWVGPEKCKTHQCNCSAKFIVANLQLLFLMFLLEQQFPMASCSAPILPKSHFSSLSKLINFCNSAAANAFSLETNKQWCRGPAQIWAAPDKREEHFHLLLAANGSSDYSNSSPDSTVPSDSAAPFKTRISLLPALFKR